MDKGFWRRRFLNFVNVLSLIVIIFSNFANVFSQFCNYLHLEKGGALHLFESDHVVLEKKLKM